MEQWNTGILEGWFLKGYYPFLILSSTQILPLTPNCIIPEPIIPLFQHSNWGEAPNSCILKYDSIFCQIHFESYANEHAVYTMTLIKSHLKNTSNVQLRRCIPLQNTHILTCMLRFFIGLPPPNIGISQSSTCY